MTLGLGPVNVGGKGPGANEGLLFVNIYVQGKKNTHFIISLILSYDDRNRNLKRETATFTESRYFKFKKKKKKVQQKKNSSNANSRAA